MLYDLYQIIEHNHLSSVLAVASDGIRHFRVAKTDKLKPLEDGYLLIFDNEAEAQQYINDVLNPEHFFVQAFSGNEEFLAKVIHP